MFPREGRVRVVVEGVGPAVDCGAFPAKRIAGETVTVRADIFTDGHDLVAAELLYRYGPAEDPPGAELWSRSPMKPLGNDRWQGEFLAANVGQYYFTIEAWIDRFATWRAAMLRRLGSERRMDSEEDLRVETLIGAGQWSAALPMSCKSPQRRPKAPLRPISSAIIPVRNATSIECRSTFCE